MDLQGINLENISAQAIIGIAVFIALYVLAPLFIKYLEKKDATHREDIRDMFNTFNATHQQMVVGVAGLATDVKHVKEDVQEVKTEVSGLKTQIGTLSSNINKEKQS